MTDTEYRDWLREAGTGTAVWKLDTIGWVNHGRAMWTRGVNHGLYVCIEKDGSASMGRYSDGIAGNPFDGSFIRLHERKFASRAEAVATVLPRLGLSWLAKGLGAY